MNKWNSGTLYRHATAKDLDMLVLKVRYKDSKRVKLLVMWVYQTTKNLAKFPGTRFDGRDNVTIKAEDFKYWSKV